MYTHMCIYVYTHRHICVHTMHICIIHTCAYAHAYMRIGTYIYICACVCMIYTDICAHIGMCSHNVYIQA